MKFLWLLLIPMCGCGIDGLHSAKPITSLEYGARGVRVYDSKDNDISFDELSIDPVTKTGVLKNFVLRNNASDVRRANVEQMMGMAAQATANWQGAERTVGALVQFAKEVMPHVAPIVAARALGNLRAATNISTPWGGGSIGGSPAGVVDGLMVIAGTQVEQPIPTTRPAEASLLERLRAASSQEQRDEIIKEALGE